MNKERRFVFQFSLFSPVLCFVIFFFLSHSLTHSLIHSLTHSLSPSLSLSRLLCVIFRSLLSLCCRLIVHLFAAEERGMGKRISKITKSNGCRDAGCSLDHRRTSAIIGSFDRDSSCLAVGTCGFSTVRRERAEGTGTRA